MKSFLLLSLVLACFAPGPAFAVEVGATTAPDTVPCTIQNQIQPRFPQRMIKDGVARGTVNVLLDVSSTGQLTDTLFTAYTRRPFADEARRVIEKWKFTPGKVKGTPVETVIELTFQFEVTEVLLVQRFSPDVEKPAERFVGYEYHACNVKTLDRVPTPLNIIEPTYPQDWMKQGIAGSVSVDFYIDETGKTRFATAAADSNELLASAAITAVQQWRFIPPKAKGRPVLVRARQIFTFEKDEKS